MVQVMGECCPAYPLRALNTQSLFDEQSRRFDCLYIHHLLGCSKVLLQRLSNLSWSCDFKEDAHIELGPIWRCKC